MLKIANKTLSDRFPLVMGILNITPDSFYDGGKITGISATLKRVEEMLKQGASIIDVGGCSTRPGAQEIPESEEIKRTAPVIEAIRKTFPAIIISIDTYRAEVSKAAIENGANIINDVSGGTIDPAIVNVAGEYKTPYVLTHIKGTPVNMQANPAYDDVTEEVILFFRNKIAELQKKGVEQIILDPGFGFGKNTEHNYELLSAIERIKKMGYPVLIGASRKSMINKVIDTKPENALNGTTVVNTIALLNGADIIRVHDVKEAVEAIKIVSFYKSSQTKSITKA